MDLVIVGGGRRPDPNRLLPACAAADAVLAADSGADWLQALSIVPDVLIGDFDSISPGVLDAMTANGRTRRVRHRVDKDQTDMELCVEEALRLIREARCRPDSRNGGTPPCAQAGDRVRIFGGIGSRIDHSLANLMLLHPFLTQGVEAWIEDRDNRVAMLGSLDGKKAGPYRVRLSREVGFRVSIVALPPGARAVTTTGLQYDMRGRDLPFDSTLAISNEFGEGDAEIAFQQGLVLLLLSRDGDRDGE